MPQAPYLVQGTIYTSRGKISNSTVRINNDIKTTTNSQGQYVLDLANMDATYSDGESYQIEAWDEFNNEYVSDTITVSGGGQTKDLYLNQRTTETGYSRGALQPIAIRSIGDKPISNNNLLPVQNLEKPMTQFIAYTSSNMAEYIGEAPPGTSTSQAKWRIKKLSYNSSNLTTNVEWANGSAKFDKTWDSRAGYSYS